jgi:magnesium transporter
MKEPTAVEMLREHLEAGNAEAARAIFASAHPAAVAEALSGLGTEEMWAALRHAPLPVRAEIFSHIDHGTQVALAESITRGELAAVLAEMPPDDRVDMLKRMPEEKREAILPALAQAEREDIRRLSSYPEGTAGAVMTSDYAVLTPGLTAQEAIGRLRLEAPDKETIYYSYVVDSDRRLQGLVSLRDLILARPEARVEDIMHKDVISVRAEDDQEEAAGKIQKYGLIALPVVSSDGALVGIVTYDDALDVMAQEQTEDMEKIMAIGGAHEAKAYLRTPAWSHFKNRVVWLVVLALIGFVSGFIVQSYESILLQFAILASFMPMLADTGGNAGSQSATLVIRALALKEVSVRDALRVLFKELQVSFAMGLVLAGIAFGRALLFSRGTTLPDGYLPAQVGIAVAIALWAQVVTSTVLGALMPLGVSRLKLDPAVVASPALTTLVDITGLLIFFATAKAMLAL